MGVKHDPITLLTETDLRSRETTARVGFGYSEATARRAILDGLRRYLRGSGYELKKLARVKKVS